MIRSSLAKLFRALSCPPQQRRASRRVQLNLESLEYRITPQATRTWVSGVGDDANPGSRTAPCKTFAGVLAKTEVGGEIDALDSGGFGAVTLTHSITIDGGDNLASILVSGSNAIVINAGPTDVIILRNLKFQGLGNGLDAIDILGAGQVIIENCSIQNFATVGIDFEPTTAGANLTVTNTDVLNNTMGGILIKPNGVAATASLDHVETVANKFGVQVQANAQVTISNSVATENITSGFQILTTGAGSALTLRNDSSSNNGGSGADAQGSSASITLTDFTATGNGGPATSNSGGSRLVSFGTNQFADNNRGFTPITPSSAVSGAATRTWVSGVGDDANPASRTAPAKTFAGAISKTASAGEIDVLDPGGFGALTITKSITIDSTGAFGSVLVAGTNGIVISAAATDWVILRGVQLDGNAQSGLDGIKILGAGVVILENCTVINFQGVGINFTPSTAGAELVVENSVVQNCAGGGIQISPGGVAATAFLDNVQTIHNGFGVSVGDNAHVTVNGSSASASTANGYQVKTSSVSGVMSLSNDTSLNNHANGVFVQGPTGGSSTISATAFISKITVTGNGGFGLLSNATGPTDSFIVSFANNVLSGNGSGSGMPTSVLPASDLSPQQRSIQALYLANLGRAGSVAELTAWVNILNTPGNTNATVVNGIANSMEAREYLVTTWYQRFLGRTPSMAEAAGQANQLAVNTEETVLANILGSPGMEFFNRAQTLVATGTPNQRYITALYELLLNRTPSMAEVNGWVNMLPSIGLVGAAFGMEQSGEYRGYQVSNDYNILLQRPPGTAEVMMWVNSPLDAHNIRLDIESSGEYFTTNSF
jgi:hypothetical protein